MKARLDIPRYTLGEEIANSVIHGVGVVLAISGLAVLTAFASLRGDAWHVVGCSVFGATLILLYATSTLYHSVQHTRAKTMLRVLDHSAIYLLIAGTYTPFTLVTLRGAWVWWLFGWLPAVLLSCSAVGWPIPVASVSIPGASCVTTTPYGISFVLLGSLLHFLAIFFYVVPSAG
jgi:channel protein (hemolysin III family)